MVILAGKSFHVKVVCLVYIAFERLEEKVGLVGTLRHILITRKFVVCFHRCDNTHSTLCM